jgi:predicted enzyme related to lactoylglutathione lyase
MSEATPRGRFVWYELMTTDAKGAQDFYTRLIDWGTQPFEGSGPEPYTMFTRGGQPVGGVMRLSEEGRNAGTPPHWLAYVGTPSVDETVAQAQKLGAKVRVPPSDIPTVGRFSVLLDPQGAQFAVFTPLPGQPPRPEAPPAVGEVSWHELATTDQEAALRFYQKLFGWEKLDAHDVGGPVGTYIIYGRNGAPLGGMFRKPPEMPGPPAFLLYVHVEDVSRLVDRVKQLGGRVLNGPMEVPGGDHIVQCLDPQGAAFALHDRARK